MTYVDRSLGPTERVVARACLAWINRGLAWTTLVAAVTLVVAILVAWSTQPMALLAAGVVLAAGWAAFLFLMIPVWTTEIAVTNQRLIVKRGLCTVSSEELELWSIEEVDWEQGIFSRMFGFGRLVVCGTGEEDMRLPLISNALEFRRAVQQAISEARPGQRPA